MRIRIISGLRGVGMEHLKGRAIRRERYRVGIRDLRGRRIGGRGSGMRGEIKRGKKEGVGMRKGVVIGIAMDIGVGDGGTGVIRK